MSKVLDTVIDEVYELGPRDRQPKNSYRYFPVKKGQSMTSMYIMRSAVSETPPRRIRVRIDED